MIGESDVGQWVLVAGTNVIGVLENVQRPAAGVNGHTGEGLVVWGVQNKRYESWVPLEEISVVPGRDPEQVALTATQADKRAGVLPASTGSGPTPGVAWCAQHRCEPHGCWPKHNPSWAISGREQSWKKGSGE